MTLQEAKDEICKYHYGFQFKCNELLSHIQISLMDEAAELYANSKLQEKEADIAELELDLLTIEEAHKAEIQKLHDHYQKQIGEWEELLKAYEEYQSVLIDEIYSLAPIATAHGWKSALTEQGKACRERIESLKHQTPAPNE